MRMSSRNAEKEKNSLGMLGKNKQQNILSALYNRILSAAQPKCHSA